VFNPRVKAWLDEYAADHQDPTNRLIHKLCVPLIVFHVLAMLDWVHLAALPIEGWSLTLGHAAAAAVLTFYFWGSTKYGLLLTVWAAACLWVSHYTPWWLTTVLAVVLWVLQLIGHRVYEQNTPSLSRNLIQALIGPLFVFAVLLKDYRVGELSAAGAR